MAAFLQHGFFRLTRERLQSYHLQPFFPWVKRTDRVYSHQACMFSGPLPNVPGSYTLGERFEDPASTTKCANNYLSISERSGDKVWDSSLIQDDGVQQYDSTIDKMDTSSQKKPLHASLYSERKIASKCRSKIEMPDPSTQTEDRRHVEDATHVSSFEMKQHGFNKKQEPHIQRWKSIVSYSAESNDNIPFSAEHPTQLNGLRLFDAIKHVPDHIGESNSMQVSEISGIEANTLKGAPMLSRGEVDSQKTKVAVKNMAIQALAARPLTASELRKKLSGKNLPSDMIDEVISEFQASFYMAGVVGTTSLHFLCGIQSDSAYAETFSQTRWLSMSWGPKRIKQALMQKGVSEIDADRAVLHVFNDGDAIDKENRWGLSHSAKVHLLAQATKQWLRGQNVPIERRKTRMIRWLQYRGFNWDVTNAVLKELQSNYPV